MKLKIGLITPDSGDACSTYRGLGPYMKLPYELNVYDGKKGFFLWEAIIKNDLIVLQRPHTDQVLGIARAVKAMGKPLIVDWDDDLSCVPPWNPFRHAFEKCLPVLQQCARLADVVTVTTKALEEKAFAWGAKRIEIVPNAIDDSVAVSLIKRSATIRKNNTKKYIAWRGSDTHHADLELCKPVILDYAKQGYVAAFFGSIPAWAYEIEHRHFPVSDCCVYLTNLSSLAPEYFICYLVDHPFNHAKSDIAAQEAYTVGARLLHNGVGAYAGLPEIGAPRLLSETNRQRVDIVASLM